MEKEIDILLKKMVENNASDLHIKVGSPPGIRLNSELIPLKGKSPLQKSQVVAFK